MAPPPGIRRGIFLLILCLTLSFDVQSQVPPVNCSSLSNLSSSDFDNLAIFTIRVNFHFIENEDGQTFNPSDAAILVDQLIANINNRFANMQQVTIPGQESTIHIPDIRFRVELYSDPDNTNDTYGGLWFYDHGSIITNHYEDKVVDIYTLYELGSDGTPNIGGSAGGTEIKIRNMYHWLNPVGSNLSPQGVEYARVIGHELGHVLGLKHTYHCNQPCSDVDIEEECNSGNPNEPCSNSNSIGPCDPINSGSNNIMANEEMDAISFCQWEEIYCLALSGTEEYIVHGTVNSECNPDGPPIIITSHEEIWSTPRILENDVVIKPGAALRIRSLVQIAPGIRIIVERGARLFLENAMLTKMCEERWAGIEVWGLSTIPTPPNGATHEDIINDVKNIATTIPAYGPGAVMSQNAWVEFADIAITTQNTNAGWPGARDYWGGLVLVDATTFSDNWKGIEIMQYLEQNHSLIQDCYFQSPENIGKTGVSIWNSSGVEISGCHFKSLRPNFDIGIRTIDAGFTVNLGCEFNNLHHAIDVQGTRIYTQPILIDDNLFEYNNVDFYINSVSNGITIEDNIFRSGRVPGNPTGAINGTTRFDVWGNLFEPSDNRAHLVCRNTGQGDSFIYNNDFAFDDTKLVHIDMVGDNSDVVFDQNCFDNARMDVRVSGAIQRDQGSPTQAFYNWFDSDNTDNQINTVGGSMEFNYFHPENPPAPNLVPVCDKFSNCTNPNNFLNREAVNDPNPPTTCGGVSPPPKMPEEPCMEFECYDQLQGELLAKYNLIDGGNTSGLIQAITNFPNNTNTLDDLENASPFLSDLVLSEVILSSAMLKQNKDAVLLSNAPLSDSMMVLAQANLDSTSYEALLTIKNLDPYSMRDSLYTALSWLERARIGSVHNLLSKYRDEQKMDSLELVINNESHPNWKRILIGVYLSKGYWSEADSVYNEYVGNFPEDTAFIEIGRINLERHDTSLQTAYTLSSVDSAYLWSLALSDKPESAEAQALLVLFQDTIFDVTITDTLATPRYTPTADAEINEETSEPKSFKVYPNPANSELFIERISPCNCEMEIVLHDVYGNLVLRETHLDQQIRLDISTVSQGIYVLTIAGQESGKESHKLMIMK